ncbi:hypothetical protein LTR53_013573 [Teratosphaeriaceae sp. CCFEE 6253]|nr:hypothetical protein LTR53_013573 [Teratosphaeriaceae sp. CCFEE 6253]
MLATPLLRRSLLGSPCRHGNTIFARCESGDNANRRSTPSRTKNHRVIRPADSSVERQDYSGDGPAKRTGKDVAGKDAAGTPSLIEQLFPEETRRHEKAQRDAAREIPRLPLENISTPHKPDSERHRAREADRSRPDAARHGEAIQRRGGSQGDDISVLVLRNASTNLVEEDFRRLIPQGRHMEGWALEDGDIIKVIPGRNLATLAQENYYYLLFSSAKSAYTYQGHATRILRLAATNTPSSMTSPMPPPPGYLVDGVDVHSAIASFALVPASQMLELRQLRPPLSPLVERIVRNKGYQAVVSRRHNMPFELRLTFDGPQLQLSNVRNVLIATARHRALTWSGGEEMSPKITQWEPDALVSPMDLDSHKAKHFAAVDRLTGEEQGRREAEAQRRKLKHDRGTDTSPNEQKQMHGRKPGAVYILGFYTEMAAQQFLRYWHKRPMGRVDEESWEDDLPPVANVETLW